MVYKRGLPRGEGGVCCHSVCHFWDCLLPCRLDDNIHSNILFGRKSRCWFTINFCDTQFEIYVRYSTQQELRISLEGTFLKNTIIRKCSKENNRKCLQINWKIVSYFAMQKWTDVTFLLTKWIFAVTILSSFYIDWLVFSESIVASFWGTIVCHFYPLKGLIKG